MMRSTHFKLFAAALFALSVNSHAASPSHMVITSSCLLEKASHYTVLAKSNQFNLIQTSDAGIDELAQAKHQTKTPCGGFIDVTSEWNQARAQHANIAKNPKAFLVHHEQQNQLKDSKGAVYEITHKPIVFELFNHMNPQNMWTDLTTLSNFYDRYSYTANGMNAAGWVKAQAEAIAKQYGNSQVQVYYVSTPGYRQQSVVAKIGNGTGPAIVVGAHIDTLFSLSETRPGADDDGTGAVTALEVFRTVLASGVKFNRPIYIVWYAAEEVGLVGSQAVVNDFKNKNIPVEAVMQLDMTGYANQNDPTMWLVNDYVDSDLTTFLKDLIEVYLQQPVEFTTCGYACSDHASWNRAGYRASMPFEAAFGKDNPYIHTTNDTMTHLSLNHMTNFEKLALAYIAELADPTIDY